MHDPALVSGGETASDLERVLDPLAARDRTGRQLVSQRLPGKELGDGVGDAVMYTEVVDAEEIRMRKRGDRLRLALEPRERRGIRAKRSGRTFTATSRSSFVSRAR